MSDVEVDLDFDLDMTGVERPNFEPAPEGDYWLLVEDVQLKTKRSAAGNLSVMTVFSIENDPENDGKKIFYNSVVSGPAVTTRSKQFLKAWLDAITEGGFEGGNVRINQEFFDTCVGNHCRAHVRCVEDNRPDVNKMKNEIGWFLFNENDKQDDDSFSFGIYGNEEPF